MTVTEPPLAPELDVLGAVAPGARLALLQAWRAAPEAVDPVLLERVRRRVEGVLGLPPPPGAAGAPPLEEAALALADQFVFYVPDVDETLLAPVRQHLGEEGLVAFVQALYV